MVAVEFFLLHVRKTSPWLPPLRTALLRRKKLSPTVGLAETPGDETRPSGTNPASAAAAIWKACLAPRRMVRRGTRGGMGLLGPCTHLPALTLQPAHTLLTPLCTHLNCPGFLSTSLVKATRTKEPH